jgi:hypothetical protein
MPIIAKDTPFGLIWLSIPDPVTVELWRRLVGQIEPAALALLLHVDERTLRRWWSGDAKIPWAAAELARRILSELPKDDPAWII